MIYERSIGGTGRFVHQVNVNGAKTRNKLFSILLISIRLHENNTGRMLHNRIPTCPDVPEGRRAPFLSIQEDP